MCTAGPPIVTCVVFTESYPRATPFRFVNRFQKPASGGHVSPSLSVNPTSSRGVLPLLRPDESSWGECWQASCGFFGKESHQSSCRVMAINAFETWHWEPPCLPERFCCFCSPPAGALGLVHLCHHEVSSPELFATRYHLQPSASCWVSIRGSDRWEGCPEWKASRSSGL